MRYNNGVILVDLNSRIDKIAVMRRKSKFREISIWIADNLTARELKIQEWVTRVAEKARSQGKGVRTGYMKSKIMEEWFF